MLSGKLYNPANIFLQISQTRARTLSKKYNEICSKIYKDLHNKDSVSYEDISRTTNNASFKILKKLFGEIGKEVIIKEPFMCDFGKNIIIKDNVTIDSDCVFLDTARINIGKNVKIGKGTCLACASHLIHPEERKKIINYSKPIFIGDNVIIGSNVTILGGVEIETGSIIPDGAVVTKNVSTNAKVNNWTEIDYNMIKKLVNDDIKNENIKKMIDRINKINSVRYINRYFQYRKLFAKSSILTFIMSPFNCVLGRNIFFNGMSFVNYNCKIIDTDRIQIGKHTLIGPGSCLTCITYDSYVCSEKTQKSKSIKIGKNVWIGANVVICGGVTIGDDSIIGAGSVVTEDIPAGVIAYGRPCKTRRLIDDSDRVILDGNN